MESVYIVWFGLNINIFNLEFKVGPRGKVQGSLFLPSIKHIQRRWEDSKVGQRLTICFSLLFQNPSQRNSQASNRDILKDRTWTGNKFCLCLRIIVFRIS